MKQLLKAAGWWAYAVLVAVLTLGLFIRFHLVTVRKRTLGGVRAGVYGGTHVYFERNPATGVPFLVIGTWHGKKRYPVNRIAYADTGPLTVSLESSGGKRSKLATWQTRTVAEFVNASVNPPQQHTGSPVDLSL